MPAINWYYNDGGKRAGPLSQEQLCELFARGQLPIETTVWSDAIGAWVAASTIAGFRDAACSAPKASILETHGFQNAVAHVPPAPRPAQLTDRAWLSRAAILAMLLIIPLGVDAALARIRQLQATPATSRLTTGGLVTRKHVETVNKKDPVFYVTYRFRANNKDYRHQEKVTPARFADTVVQQPVTVSYVAANPRESTIDPPPPKPQKGPETSRRVVLGSFGALAGCLLLLEQRIHRQRFLCTHGAATVGRVTDQRGAQSRYAFTTSDGHQFVRTFPRNASLTLGSPLTVLYDANNPNCSYPLEVMRLAKIPKDA
jgi:hypothetical protein